MAWLVSVMQTTYVSKSWLAYLLLKSRFNLRKFFVGTLLEKNLVSYLLCHINNSNVWQVVSNGEKMTDAREVHHRCSILSPKVGPEATRQQDIYYIGPQKDSRVLLCINFFDLQSPIDSLRSCESLPHTY